MSSSKDTAVPSSKGNPPPAPRPGPPDEIPLPQTSDPTPFPPAPMIKPPVIPDPPDASMFLTPMKIWNWIAGFPLTGDLKNSCDTSFTRAYKMPLSEFNDYPGLRGDVAAIRKKMELNSADAPSLRERLILGAKVVFAYDAKSNLVTQIDPWYLDLFTELGYMNALNMALEHLMEDALTLPLLSHLFLPSHQIPLRQSPKILFHLHRLRQS